MLSMASSPPTSIPYPLISVPTTPLPGEILSTIITLLPTKDIITCVRVSQLFFDVAAASLFPLLYRNITIDVSRSHPPVFLHCSPSPAIWIDIKLPSINLSMDDNIHPHPFTYTQNLTLIAHERSMCCTCFPLDSPFLQTLLINPGNHTQSLDLCSYSSSASTSQTWTYNFNQSITHTQNSISCCPLLAHLRPKHLILGGITTDLSGHGKGLWASPNPLPSSITNLTLLVGMYTGRELDGITITSLLLHLPLTVKTITFVLSPCAVGWTLIPTSNPILPSKWNKTIADEMMMSLVEACLAIKGNIRIIGSGSVVEFSKTANKLQFQGALTENLKARWVSEGWSDADAEVKARRVTFDTEGGLRVGGGDWYKLLKEEWRTKYNRRWKT